MVGNIPMINSERFIPLVHTNSYREFFYSLQPVFVYLLTIETHAWNLSRHRNQTPKNKETVLSPFATV